MGIGNEFNKASFAIRAFDNGDPTVQLDRGGGKVLSVENNADLGLTPPKI